VQQTIGLIFSDIQLDLIGMTLTFPRRESPR
jgi:hypothetical protein